MEDFVVSVIVISSHARRRAQFLQHKTARFRSSLSLVSHVAVFRYSVLVSTTYTKRKDHAYYYAVCLMEINDEINNVRDV